jgi:Zn-dependent protease with chaperone function
MRLFGYLVGFWIAASLWSSLAVWMTGVAALLAAKAFGYGVPSIFWPWRTALAIAAVLSAVYAACTLARSERWILKKLGYQIVPKGVLLESKTAVKDMAIASGMPVAPAMYSTSSRAVNAFVFHALGRRPIVGVTQGFPEKLDVEQQRAVFANLMARLITGDIMVASAVCALVVPLQTWRDHRLTLGDDTKTPLFSREKLRRAAARPLGSEVLFLFAFGPAIVLLAEVLAGAFRRFQRTAAEKADAEGMLLLKDPAAMLSALEAVVVRDNAVSAAGEIYAPLFYVRTGVSTHDDEDPTWRRVARLREVLGADGLLVEDPPFPAEELPPPPPWIADTTVEVRDQT